MLLTKLASISEVAWLETFFGHRRQQFEGVASAVDVVTYAASLASDPREVDPILDDLRVITSQLSIATPLSIADQARLALVYHRLETYLVEGEQLRKFDRLTIRNKLQQKFPHRKPEEAAFWSKIAA